ncbi:hemerythrin domain-containing protein [Clostridium sp. D53t1_180928_C8]|uniref:hemerythrin domain-containing protein n=1 Tax=Clostridium sp. D53t1_180928_C8 TaxID=2787101 RepID=UPI0018A98A8F|nr:hemerythrin domain-containing protein [Clostridium sp. D53t1_180928_C8]
MKAIEIMNEEHKYILRMLTVVRKACLSILDGKEIIYEDFNNIIEFIQLYADRHHHKKEEKILFIKMVENIGETAEKVVNQGMLVEHDLGRLYVRNLIEALDKVKKGDLESKLDIISNAISYTHLLARHIDKEDRVIYKFAERELDEEVLGFINIECENFENNNKDIKDKYLYILGELEKKYKVSE